jgi:hypothetical protein
MARRRKIRDSDAKFLAEDPSMEELRLFVPLRVIRQLVKAFLEERTERDFGDACWILKADSSDPGLVVVQSPSVRA